MIKNKNIKTNKITTIFLVLLIIFTQVTNLTAYAARDGEVFVGTVELNREVNLSLPAVEGLLIEVKMPVYLANQQASKEANGQEELKRLLYEALQNRQEDLYIDYYGTIDEVLNLDDLFTEIIEEIFAEDHYIHHNCEGYYGYYSYNYNGEANLSLTLSYRTSKEDEAFVTKEVNRILSQIITPRMSDREKVKAVHDYIVLNVEYDLSLMRYTAYHALYDGTTVCQGYALLGHKMLNQLGIKTRIFASYGMNHAWNLVNLDGKWYHMDMTWNDPTPDVKGRVIYDYYLLTDSEIKDMGHSWEPEEYPTSGEGFKPSLFKDVPLDHWANEQIEDLAQKNVIKGYGDGNFRPGDNVTRAHAAVMLVNALGLDYKGKTPNFTDVKSDHWAAGHIAAAREAGIINGYRDGKFGPGDYITRGQIAVMISKAFNLKHSGTYKNFNDVDAGYWAYKEVEALASNGIINGYSDNTFRPGEYSTRAHFSVFLSKSLSNH